MIETPNILQKTLGRGLLGLLLAYAAVRSIFACLAKTFWYDEFLTVTVASLGSWSARLHALSLPLDGQPPLFYTIEHYATGLARNQQIALRLPAVVAFLCTLVCVYVYVKKRSREAIALVCAGALLMTELFRTYAVEARPYSMVVACIAFAVICYQRLPSPLWTALLGISLVLAESLHYLAVLAIVPFALAEVVVWLKTRRIRWAVWCALVAGALPLFAQWKLVAINKAYYGPHFWAKFVFSNLPRTYGEYFDVHSAIGGGIAGLALGGIALAYLSSTEEKSAGESDAAAEAILLTGLVSLPFIAYVLVVVVMHSGLTGRYALATVLGLSLALGYALSRASWKAVFLAAAFTVAAVGVQELSFWRNIGTGIKATTSNASEIESFVNSAGYRELPVAIPNSMFLPLLHYVSPPLAARLVFISHRGLEDEKLSDTTIKGMALLGPYAPMRMIEYYDFLAKHKEFLLYEEDRDPGRDWFVLRLSKEGWKIQTVNMDEYRILYLVSHG